MKKKVIIGIIIVAVLGGAVYFRSRTRASRLKSVSVKVGAVAKGDIKSYLSTTAVIKSKNSKDYYGVSAKVLKVNVKVGDSVTKGQVLVQYDVQDLSTNVKTAQVTYDNAQVAYQNALSAKNDAVNTNNQNSSKLQDLNIDAQINDYTNRLNTVNDKISGLENEINSLQNSTAVNDKTTVNNDKILLYGGANGVPNLVPGQGGLYSQRDSLISSINSFKNQKAQYQPMSAEKMKQLDNAITTAKNNIETAKANLDAAQANQAKSVDKIVADFDGVVTAVNVSEGAVGNAAQAAVTIQDLNTLEADVTVGKYDADKVKVGEDAVVKASGKEYKGKVSFIDPAAKQTTSASGTDTTLGVKVDITDNAEGLKVNFSDDIDILLGEVKDIVKIPVEAVKADKTGKNFVYVVQNNKAVEKEVKLGLQSETEAQITDGVSPGDKVILNPAASIKDGTTVKESVGVGK